MISVDTDHLHIASSYVHDCLYASFTAQVPAEVREVAKRHYIYDLCSRQFVLYAAIPCAGFRAVSGITPLPNVWQTIRECHRGFHGNWLCGYIP